MTEFSRAARSVPCPRCGALKNSPCRTPLGKATYAHAVRDRLVRDAFVYGYEAGLSDAIDLGDQAVQQLEFVRPRNRDRARPS